MWIFQQRDHSWRITLQAFWRRSNLNISLPLDVLCIMLQGWSFGWCYSNYPWWSWCANWVGFEWWIFWDILCSRRTRFDMCIQQDDLCMGMKAGWIKVKDHLEWPCSWMMVYIARNSSLVSCLSNKSDQDENLKRITEWIVVMDGEQGCYYLSKDILIVDTAGASLASSRIWNHFWIRLSPNED